MDIGNGNRTLGTKDKQERSALKVINLFEERGTLPYQRNEYPAPPLCLGFFW